MPAPLSVDLRERVVAAVAAGEYIAKVARRFGVTRPTIYSWLALREETGSVEPRTRPERGRVLDEYREQIEEKFAGNSSVTLVELKEQLDLPVGISALWEALDEWGLTFKKKSARV
jgi:putative transposase